MLSRDNLHLHIVLLDTSVAFARLRSAYICNVLCWLSNLLLLLHIDCTDIFLHMHLFYCVYGVY